MLIVLGGLPGTGKTTIARAVVRCLGAVHLRIDTIEQAIRDAGLASDDVCDAGYVVAYRIAADNLALGRTIIADSVNGCAETRGAWRAVAARNAIPILEVELVCSDLEVHRHRVATRVGDIAGLVLPDWEQVCGRDYQPREDTRLILDTAKLDVAAATAAICKAAETHARHGSRQKWSP